MRKKAVSHETGGFVNSAVNSSMAVLAVADPGFSRGGAPTLKEAIIWPLFPQNCMKLKEFGPPGGGRASLAPP